MKVCSICSKRIKADEGQASDAIREEDGQIIFRVAHLGCSIRTGLTDYQKVELEELNK